MLPLALLLFPLSVLASPPSRGQARSVSFRGEVATWTDTDTYQNPYTLANEISWGESGSDNRAPCDDCLDIQRFAFNQNGTWTFNHVPSGDADDWNLLSDAGTCAVLVKNSAPTVIGNTDISIWLAILYDQTCHQNNDIEQKSQMKNADNVVVDLWLRNAGGLGLYR
ncbi:hypothetical protein F4781DRAFT_50728 [Annulohypoxylon bovei var. microspora]|nr:hypothetical protein F4781DRAFT_50728 [Annulohypoxylon bovei var. microspora]